MVACSSNAPQLLRLKQVKEVTGLSRSSIYCEVAAGRFPKQIRITSKTVGWLADEVNDFVMGRVAQSRNFEQEAA